MRTIRDIGDRRVTIDSWSIYTKHSIMGDRIEIYILKDELSKRYVCHFNSTGIITMEELVEGSMAIDPTMIMPYEVWDGIKGVFEQIEETPQKVAVDAELHATKYHLEDMRHLLKLPPKLLKISGNKIEHQI